MKSSHPCWGPWVIFSQNHRVTSRNTQEKDSPAQLEAKCQPQPSWHRLSPPWQDLQGLQELVAWQK